jgi:hypothetical protein
VTTSATLHAVAVVWLATRTLPPEHTRDPAAAQPIEIVTVDPLQPVPPEPEALEVAIAPDPPAREPQAATPAPPRAPSPDKHRDARITVGASAPSAGSAAGSADESAPRSPERRGLMAMRRGDLPRPVVPVGRWDDLDHPPAGTTPEKHKATGMLQESGGGSYRSEQGEFVARVNPDGTVKLADKSSASIGLALPSREQIGNGLRTWYERDKGAFGEAADATMSGQLRVTSGASTDPVDPVTNRNNDRAPTVAAPVVGGKLEITDWLMRRHGIDPYASKKLAMLDATRDERVQIGNRHRAEQLKHGAQIMKRNLDGLWAATQDPLARKQALFEMWDECAETGDPDLVEAGQAARRMVIGIIRARLPAGSPGAFTAAELEAVARTKRSKAAFAPYD